MNLSEMFSPKELIRCFTGSAMGRERALDELQRLDAAIEQHTLAIVNDASAYHDLLAGLGEDYPLLDSFAKALHRLMVCSNTDQADAVVSVKNALMAIAEERALEDLEETWKYND